MKTTSSSPHCGLTSSTTPTVVLERHIDALDLTALGEELSDLVLRRAPRQPPDVDLAVRLGIERLLLVLS